MKYSSDIILGVGVYELISKTGALLTFAACYRFRPFYGLVRTKLGMKYVRMIRMQFPTATSYVENKITHTANWFSANQYAKKIPEKFNLRAKRFGKALLETVFIYHLMIPLYGTVTYKVVLRRYNKKLEEEMQMPKEEDYLSVTEENE
jgi:hypothetical protein